MSDNVNGQSLPSGNAPPTWFWVVSGIGLIWNLLGVAAFANQMTMDLNALSSAERGFYEAMPVWATVAFAVAVFGGALGCIALLGRRRAAFQLLVLSLMGIVVQMSHSIFIANGIEIFGPAGAILPLLTLCIGIALVFLARNSATRGWLT